MFRRHAWLALTLIALASTASAAPIDTPAGRYALERNHAYLMFSYTHLGYSHPKVLFRDFSADLTLDPANPAAASVVVAIKVGSVDSGVAEFDQHLVGADYFDAGKFPEMRFQSTAVEMTGDTTANVTGNLTVKDVTRPVTLAVTLNRAAAHPMMKVPTLGFSATTTIKRSEFGLANAVPFVSDEVVITIEAEMLHQP